MAELSVNAVKQVFKIMCARKHQGYSNALFPFTLSVRVNKDEYQLYKGHVAKQGLVTSHWIPIAIANQ
jgi:hypothetical protein